MFKWRKVKLNVLIFDEFLHFCKLDDIFQDNMSLCFIPPYTSLLHSKTGVYRGLHYFLIFAVKHILWILVRTASMRRF